MRSFSVNLLINIELMYESLCCREREYLHVTSLRYHG